MFRILQSKWPFASFLCLFKAIPLNRILCNRIFILISYISYSLFFFTSSLQYLYFVTLWIDMRCDMMILLFSNAVVLFPSGLFLSIDSDFQQQIDQNTNTNSIATFYLDDWLMRRHKRWPTISEICVNTPVKRKWQKSQEFLIQWLEIYRKDL